MQEPITIAGITIQPGTRTSIELPIPSFYTHTSASMPIHVVHGNKPGPCLLICAAIHGDEINGVEIIRRILTHKTLNKIKGTLIAIPIVNVFGFVSQSRYLPDRRDLNRSFPGSRSGSMASRLANMLMTEIIDHCTHVIDLHTGAIARENLPQIRACLRGEPETEAIARAFGVPVIINSELRDGSLREAAREHNNIPVLLYEAGEALRFDEVSIRAGVRGILGVMSYLGMRPKSRKKKEYETLISRSTQWVRAPESGILRSVIPLGTLVKKGDILAYINDPLGEIETNVTSTVSGIVIGKTNLPLAHEGEAIFHIAKFVKEEEISNYIETYHDELDPLTDEVKSEQVPLV
ncbi:succinylglutamate desuccinylase/aspartoacylase family protein [Methanococcoides orientis]|uniref:succinylglutamate desuccinylase/aspartoacylase family protein n=1 Tax=Methanococcoides orientis TaxID=2822137 RepID=UPI001E44E859|nr:succinylglutamate desuccinylase/aspartoacylase family protein [Methanococcoides orientis]UGV41629.1 succinylglutamate desuccinylase/aspartoacylase family protein [Methanococcoides orientis]